VRPFARNAAFAVLFVVLTATEAAAQRIENEVAVFAALDKVTARIQRLEIKLGNTETFGALKITPQSCFSRAPTEPPKTTTFVRVEEMQLDGSRKPIFAGWMFADSPGLNAMEHPVFDVWLTECASPKAIAAAAPALPKQTRQGAARVPTPAAPQQAPTSGWTVRTEDDPLVPPRRRPPR
jgi:hypothetical protein